MALSTKAGQFTTPSSTGNNSITGLGFQPELVFFFGNDNTSDTWLDDYVFYFGVAGDSSNQACIEVFSDDGVTTSNVASRYDKANCFGSINVAATSQTRGAFVSMDADGFTINWTTASATQRKVNYIALGGDITGVKIQRFDQKTSSGSQSVTGVGFEPDMVMIFQSRVTTNNPPSGASVNSFPRLGFATSSSAEGYVANRIRDGLATGSDTARAQKIDAVTGHIQSTTETISNEAEFTSMDADGFTLNWTTVDGSAYRMLYVAVAGGQWYSGNFARSGSTGDQSVTGVGFQPTGLLLAHNSLGTTGAVAHARLHVGATDGTNEYTVFAGDEDALSTTDNINDLDSTKMLKSMTEGTPSTEWTADIVSLDSDGFTLNAATSDADTEEILYLAFGSNAGGVSDLSISKSESVTVTESKTAVVESFINKSETSTVSESVSVVLPDALAISRSEAITVGESVSAEVVFTISKSEGVTVSETVTVVLPDALTVTVTDATTVSESVSRTLVSLISATESVGVAESVSVNTSMTINVSDSLSVVDQPSALVSDPQVQVLEAITIGESFTVEATPLAHVTMSEDVGVGEVVTVEIEIEVGVVDNVDVGDVIYRELDSFISKSEAVTVVDAPNVSQTYNLSVSDQITVTENRAFSYQQKSIISGSREPVVSVSPKDNNKPKFSTRSYHG